MAEKKFTEEQLSAINTRDRSLLVSAAAGSGKTATLTERIIRQITDKSDPKKISDMLIVTFTLNRNQGQKERPQFIYERESMTTGNYFPFGG